MMILDNFLSMIFHHTKYRHLISALLFFALTSATTTTSATEQSNLRIEKNEPSEFNDLIIRSIGAFKFEQEKQAHIELVHTESPSLGNRLALDFGGGYVFAGSVSLFLGVGVSLEYSYDIEEFNDKYYAEAGAIFDLSRELSVTARQQHFFHQPDDYEEVIMLGILFRH